MAPVHARRRGRLIALLSPITLLLCVFFIAPLSILLVYSFLEPGLYGGVVWQFYDQNFGRILGWADGSYEEFDPVYLGIFARSFRLAITTVLISLVLCYPAAMWVSALPDRWKSFFLFLITLPFFASLVVRLFAWVLILKPTGWINETLTGIGLIARPLDMLYTEGAVVLGMVYIFIPFMFLPLYASLEKLDRSLIDASKDLGAGRLKTFMRVTLPLSVPGMVGGSIIVFIPSLGNFIVPDLLGGAKVLMIGNLVEQQFLQARNWPFGSALAWMVMFVVLVFLLIYVAVIDRADAMQEREAMPMRRSPGTFAGRMSRHTLLIYSVLFFAFIYAPMVIVIVYSFNANPVNMMSWSGFTFDWYRTIFGLGTKLTEQTLYVESTEQLTNAVGNSLIVALTTTTISTLIGTSTALAMARFRFRFKSFYRVLVFMPMIIPDIVLGIALLIYFVTLGARLGLMTIIIGHCTFLCSYVFIVVSARLAGMDQTCEEASADLGANSFQTFRRVTLPLILPGVIGGALLAFIISMDDLVITYFIAGVDSTTLPVFIYGMLRRGIKPEINAIASLMILFSLVIASLGLWFRSRSSR